LDADPARLAEVEARRNVLTTLIRRYGDDVHAVLDWAARSERRLLELDVSDDALAALAQERDAAASRCAKLATELTRHRTKAAARLAEAVSAELAGLAMGQANVQVDVRPRPAVDGQPSLIITGAPVGAGRDGCDDVEFTLAARPDAPALPLGRGASGGELSRVMLALEVCLAGTDPVPTMVFDEVDSGVGGRAAVEVGQRLAALARDHQVLVVTHLAQVAAYADQHLVVDRDDEGRRTTVRMVGGADRVRELARMLAGSDSPTARKHATELLADARRSAPDRSPAKTAKTRS
ncbi:MAG: DNA repair protein RecN, partial [Actinobacteria bacterium]|nr:DNA repair protein RecN [Actinomycetota bacterium]